MAPNDRNIPDCEDQIFRIYHFRKIKENVLLNKFQREMLNLLAFIRNKPYFTLSGTVESSKDYSSFGYLSNKHLQKLSNNLY